MHSFIFLYISYCREYFYFKTVKNNYFNLLSLPPPLPPFWIFSFYFIHTHVNNWFLSFFFSFFLFFFDQFVRRPDHIIFYEEIECLYNFHVYSFQQYYGLMFCPAPSPASSLIFFCFTVNLSNVSLRLHVLQLSSLLLSLLLLIIITILPNQRRVAI